MSFLTQEFAISFSKGPKYRFPSNNDFPKCRREITASSNDFSNRWCKMSRTSEPEFYCDLDYKLKKIVGSNIFSSQFIKIISHYKKIGNNINVLRQTACLVVNPIMVGIFDFLFICTPLGRTSDSMTVPT